MIDRIFTSALVFTLLAGGTLAVGSEWMGGRTAATSIEMTRTVELPRVVVIGHRAGASTHVASAASLGTAVAADEATALPVD